MEKTVLFLISLTTVSAACVAICFAVGFGLALGIRMAGGF